MSARNMSTRGRVGSMALQETLNVVSMAAGDADLPEMLQQLQQDTG